MASLRSAGISPLGAGEVGTEIDVGFDWPISAHTSHAGEMRDWLR